MKAFISSLLDMPEEYVSYHEGQNLRAAVNANSSRRMIATYCPHYCAISSRLRYCSSYEMPWKRNRLNEVPALIYYITLLKFDYAVDKPGFTDKHF